MRIILYLILAYVIYRLLKGVFLSGHTGQKIEKRENGGMIDEMVQDPVCGTFVLRRKSISRTIDGETYFFCSDECASQFEAQKE
ncbi:MAG: YHS domain-containing protein [Deltaproteobacteria bacterium]|nr:YHS domain-containing protein [Deltaproteobacteria bacterium]